MNNTDKEFRRKVAPKKSARMVETIYGCKWSLTIFQLLADGVNRPGKMVQQTDGLTTKVLNSCLKRNIEFGIIERIAYPEVPPRVEYRVTSFGTKFIRILDQLEALQDEIDEEQL